MAALFVVEGPNRGTLIRLVPGANRIGRDERVEVYLPDASVSRVHAEITLEDEGFSVRDLKSKNRTYLNGVPLCAPTVLRGGDELRLGEVVLTYAVSDHEAGTERAAADGSTVSIRGGGSASRTRSSPIPRPPASRSPSRPAGLGAKLRYLIGESPAIGQIAARIARCAPLETTVLITGETGTGKELVAQALHQSGPRRSAPFLAINCATLAPALLESELFGHERGAFTGAVAKKLGKLELAQGGTLFLDEIGELPPDAQAKLLRAVDQRQFQRLGGHALIRSTARVVYATHRDLPAEIREGRFREDLYYRLRVVEIAVPPLRERPGDIPILARYFLAQLRRKIPTPVRDLSEAAIARLRAYRFPGNVRELKNLIEHCLIFCDEALIEPRHLPFGTGPEAKSRIDPFACDENGEPLTLLAQERAHLARVLDRTGWNKAEAARLLGIDRKTLYGKLKRHGLST